MQRTLVGQLHSLLARIDLNVLFRLFFERKNNIRPWNSGEKRECLVILEKAGLYDGHDGEGGGILDKLATDREVSEI